MALFGAPHTSTFADVVRDGGVLGIVIALEGGGERWHWWDRIEIFLLFGLGWYILVGFE